MDEPIELNGIERAHLSAWSGEESFKIVQRLMISLVKEFDLDLINASKNEDIIAKHHIAKAAAMYYQRFVDRLNSEIYVYQNSPKKGDKPVDITANLELDNAVDLESLEEVTSNAPNLLERE
jgi:hypothetical protein